MATARNTNNTKVGSRPKAGRAELLASNISKNNTAKQNYTAIEYGNDHGSISFGHIHKQGDVTSDVLIEASDARHSIILDKDGPRKGGTQITAPGRISIESGVDKSEGEDTLFIHSWNGNIDIVATNGKLRLQGTDVEIIAVGEGGSKGNIQVTTETGTIKLKGDKVLVDAASLYKLATSGTAQILASNVMQIYAPLIRGVTDAVCNKNDKNNNKRTRQQLSK
jgi:hypothetical protein